MPLGPSACICFKGDTIFLPSSSGVALHAFTRRSHLPSLPSPFAPAPLQVVGPGCRAEAERAASGNGSGKRGPDLRAWETNAVPVGADSSPLCRSTQYDSYLPSRSTFPSAHTHLPSSLRPQTCHFTLPPAPPTLPLLLGATDCR